MYLVVVQLPSPPYHHVYHSISKELLNTTLRVHRCWQSMLINATLERSTTRWLLIPYSQRLLMPLARHRPHDPPKQKESLRSPTIIFDLQRGEPNRLIHHFHLKKTKRKHHPKLSITLEVWIRESAPLQSFHQPLLRLKNQFLPQYGYRDPDEKPILNTQEEL